MQVLDEFMSENARSHGDEQHGRSKGWLLSGFAAKLTGIGEPIYAPPRLRTMKATYSLVVLLLIGPLLGALTAKLSESESSSCRSNNCFNVDCCTQDHLVCKVRTDGTSYVDLAGFLKKRRQGPVFSIMCVHTEYENSSCLGVGTRNDFPSEH